MTFTEFKTFVERQRPDIEVRARQKNASLDATEVPIVYKKSNKMYFYRGTYQEIIYKLGITDQPESVKAKIKNEKIYNLKLNIESAKKQLKPDYKNAFWKKGVRPADFDAKTKEKIEQMEKELAKLENK